jgi:hypothetical protein
MVREQPEKLKHLVHAMLDQHLASDGLIVFRHDVQDRLDFAGARVADARTYGGMDIELLRRQ